MTSIKSIGMEMDRLGHTNFSIHPSSALHTSKFEPISKTTRNVLAPARPTPSLKQVADEEKRYLNFVL